MVPITLTCVQFASFQQEMKQEAAPELTEEHLLHELEDRYLELDMAPEDDMVLALYRNPLFHQQVRDFFYQETASYQISDIILEAAAHHEIPMLLAFSLAWAESSYRVDAVNKNSHSIDRGLFQLNNRSFPELSTKEFFDPEINADQGMEYLASCLELGENRVVALAMYNAGRGRVNGRGTPKMTLDYISKVLDHYDFLEERFESRHLRGKRRVKEGSKVRYVLDRGKISK